MTVVVKSGGTSTPRHTAHRSLEESLITPSPLSAVFYGDKFGAQNVPVTPDMPARRLLLLFSAHLLFSAIAATAFAWKFDYTGHVVAAHVLLVAEWDLASFALIVALVPFVGLPRQTLRVLLASTGTLQAYLYALNIVSNMSWDRNMTAHLISAFAPTVWSGKEPFPVGPVGISVFLVGTCAAISVAVALWGRSIDDGWEEVARGTIARRRLSAALAIAVMLLFATTVRAGVGGRDNLFWKSELVSAFFRPEGFAFEPTARRHAVAKRDAALRAAYPHHAVVASRKNIVLIIVDSLRADHMQVYGYARRTTPFLSSLVDSGRMKKVAYAFSTCS